jgi:drug/metabolite transporter (DMT)-like permease
MNKTPSRYFVFVGLLFSSMSSFFIRLIDGPSLTVAAYRLVAASAFFMVPFVLQIKSNKNSATIMTKADVAMSIASGFFLAGHFATWISSLAYTSVASSTVLVSLSPVFVATFNRVFLKEKLKQAHLVGMVVALAGAIIIADGGFRLSRSALLGDSLALLGAVFVSGYIIIGRYVRKQLDLVSYVFITYASAAVFLILVASLSAGGMAYGTFSNLGLMILHGLVSSGVGHTLYNWMLQYTSSTFVSVATLGEPLIASIMVFLFFSETPTVQTVVGGVIVILGLLVFSREGKIVK